MNHPRGSFFLPCPVINPSAAQYTSTMMNETKEQNTSLRAALELLPLYLRSAVYKAIRDRSLDPDSITDIRLRRDGISYISVGRDSYPLEPVLSARQMDDVVYSLSQGSVYAHAGTIKEGYINARGFRAGICGRAVLKNGAVDAVTEYSSVTLRIPHDVTGCAAEVYRLFCRKRRGILIYSPPGVGKTTLLRDLMRLLSGDGAQFAVIDTRGELSRGNFLSSADVLLHYPKAEGIRLAVRSLSPHVILCDELAGDDDAKAARYAYSSGVPIIATAHAGSIRELTGREDMAELLSSGAFPTRIGLARTGGGFIFTKEETE